MQFKWTVEAWGAKWTTNYDDYDDDDVVLMMIMIMIMQWKSRQEKLPSIK